MSVPGIRFYPTSVSADASSGTPIFTHGALQNNRSDFDYLFSCLYPHWTHLRFVDDGAFRMPMTEFTEAEEEEWQRSLDRWQVDSRKDRQWNMLRILRSCQAFQQFGRDVYEFEGAGFTLLSPETSFQRSLDIEKEVWTTSIKVLPAEVECILQNWDGVFWQIFTDKEEWLQILTERHAADPHVPAYRVDIKDEFPDPRGSSPEDAGLQQIRAALGDPACENDA